MKKINYQVKAYLIQLIFSVVLILLSLIGLFFGVWESLVSVSIASVFAFGYLFAMLFGAKRIGVNTKNSAGFLVSTMIRYLLAAVGMFIPALIIKLTEVEPNKFRYLNVISATIPFLVVNLTLNLIKNDILKDGE